MMNASRPLTEIRNLEEIPEFASEAEEHAFWATHELSDTLWDQAEPFQAGVLPRPRLGATPAIIRGDDTLCYNQADNNRAIDRCG